MCVHGYTVYFYVPFSFILPFISERITYLETANIPPFIDPKQESATKIGTAKEKFPSRRSEKV